MTGGGGTNTLIYHNAGGFALTDTYTLGTSDLPAWDARLHRLTSQPVYSSQINRYELHAAGGNDLIQIGALPATMTGGVFVKGNVGNDTITVGTATTGLNGINAVVNVDGGADTNTLIVDNRGSAIKNLTETKTAVTRADGQVTLPTGVTVSAQNQGSDDSLDSDFDSTGSSGTIDVTPGMSLDLDIGWYY